MVLQLDLFIKYFDPDNAVWKARSYNPAHIECESYIIIPKSVKSPLDEKSCSSYSDEYKRLIDIWSAHVHAIAWAIPNEVERAADDVNGWRMAYQLLEKHRDSQESIRVLIQDHDADCFLNTVVVDC